MEIRNFLERFRFQGEFSKGVYLGDPQYNRVQGLSYSETQEVLSALSGNQRVLGLRASLRRIQSSEDSSFVMLTNSLSLFNQQVGENVILIVTSLNPIAFSLSLGREEPTSVALWTL